MSEYESRSIFLANSRRLEKSAIPQSEKELLICYLTVSQMRDLFFDSKVNLESDIPDSFLLNVLWEDLISIKTILIDHVERDRRDIIQAGKLVNDAFRTLDKAIETPVGDPRRARMLIDFRNRIQDAYLHLEALDEISGQVITNEQISADAIAKILSKKHTDRGSHSGIEPPDNEPPEIGGEGSPGDGTSAEEVWFTAFHPEKGRVETWLQLLVYAHVASAVKEVRKDAKRFQDQLPAPKETGSSVPGRIKRGTEITIVPNCEGITFNPSRLTLQWLEDFHRAEFRFRADRSLIDDAAKGTITIFVGPLIVATVKFAMLFSNRDDATASDTEAGTGMYHQDRIFISYSHKDTEVALAFKKVHEATGYDVLIDIDDLRSGQEWNPELMHMIDRADIFQLFWSENSSNSKYCQQEWQHALERDLEGFVRPVYWRKPMPDPPGELEKYHFEFVEW